MMRSGLVLRGAFSTRKASYDNAYGNALDSLCYRADAPR